MTLTRDVDSSLWFEFVTFVIRVEMPVVWVTNLHYWYKYVENGKRIGPRCLVNEQASWAYTLTGFIQASDSRSQK
jgi:hypothetical protein